MFGNLKIYCNFATANQANDNLISKSMTREEINAKVKHFLVEEIEVEETAITPEAHLKDDLGIDSLDFVDIVVIVERYFGFKIKAEEMANVQTLSQFCDYIEAKVGNKEG